MGQNHKYWNESIFKKCSYLENVKCKNKTLMIDLGLTIIISKLLLSETLINRDNLR